MYKLYLNPRKVVPYEDCTTTQKFVDIARKGTKTLEKESGCAPVIETPAEFAHLGKYTLLDGHHRRATAIAAGVLLPVAVICVGQDDPSIDIRGDLTDFVNMTQEQYDEWVGHARRGLSSALESKPHIFTADPEIKDSRQQAI